MHAGTVEGGVAPSVYPDACRLTVERRTLPGETASQVMTEMAGVVAEARRSCPQLDATLKRGLFRESTEVPAESALVAELRQACRRCGIPGAVEGMSAWVDACFLNQSGTPAVCFGPGSIAQAHTGNEWAGVSEIELGTRILTDFARGFVRASGGASALAR